GVAVVLGDGIRQRDALEHEFAFPPAVDPVHIRRADRADRPAGAVPNGLVRRYLRRRAAARSSRLHQYSTLQNGDGDFVAVDRDPELRADSAYLSACRPYLKRTRGLMCDRKECFALVHIDSTPLLAQRDIQGRV